MKTLAFLKDEYLRHLESLNRSQYTVKNIRNHVSMFLRYLQENFSVDTADAVRKDHLYMFQKRMGERRGKKGSPLTPKSVNRTLGSIRGFLKHLASRGYTLSSLTGILQNAKEPKFLPLDALEHTEMKKLIRVPDTGNPQGFRDRAMLELMYSSGLRAGEVVGLDLENIDIKRANVRVMGKGRKERIVPIGETAARYLETYLKAVRPFMLKAGAQKAFFINYTGTRVRYHTILRRLRGYAENASVKIHVTPHTFRRSCATELIRGGANIYHVKELLGHECLDTLKHYTKLTINDLKKTHERCHPREKDGN